MCKQASNLCNAIVLCRVKGRFLPSWWFILLIGTSTMNWGPLLEACSSLQWLHLFYILPSSPVIGSLSFYVIRCYARIPKWWMFPPFRPYEQYVIHQTSNKLKHLWGHIFQARRMRSLWPALYNFTFLIKINSLFLFFLFCLLFWYFLQGLKNHV